jgi:NADH dehydrogenase
VIHLVGIISEVGERTFENVHVKGTENILAAARHAGIERFLHMSALGTRPDALSRYHQSKWAAEEAVRASDLDCTIFRPSLIYGPDDHFVNFFAKIIRRSPVVPLVGSPTAKFQPVSVEAVARGFIKGMHEPRSIGQTYDLAGQDVLTFPEIVDTILKVMGRRRLKLRLPQSFVRMQAALLEFVFPRLLRKAPPLNRDQLVMLEEDNVGNPQPANQLFDLKPVPLAEGIARYL